MDPIREEIAALQLSGITRVAAGAIGNPSVIPLWFGESDIVTPDFIREAAKRALDEGRTFYNYPRGIVPFWVGIGLDTCNQRAEPMAAVVHGLFFGRVAPSSKERRARRCRPRGIRSSAARCADTFRNAR